jgi:ATP-binding cassette subfamily B protein
MASAVLSCVRRQTSAQRFSPRSTPETRSPIRSVTLVIRRAIGGFPLLKREFVVADAPIYDRTSPVRWIISHVLHYRRWVTSFFLATIVTNLLSAYIPILTGDAFNEILRAQPDASRLLLIALGILGLVLSRAGLDLVGRFSAEILGKRFKRDAREELYASLLGKSQTFHNRQRVGDLMARAANDVDQLSNMIVPGVDSIVDSFSLGIICLVFIGFLRFELLLAPLLFTAVFVIALRVYARELGPVAGSMRGQFGRLNAVLTEAVTGIEVVKSTAQEPREKGKFDNAARRYRDFFVKNGQIQARYLPPLLLTIATVGGFLHGLLLIQAGQISVGTLIAYMGLMNALGYPAFMSIFTFYLVQLGLAGSERILEIMKEETELDENEGGYAAEIRGEIVFENVTFRYGAEPVLKNVTFRASPGQTVAIVGRTGSGKSTLTKLVNRIYDVSEGRILIDGVDVREWSLESLRSQVSTIEQDVFLFSRSISENIAFGLGQKADRSSIEAAAHDAQAHGFISGFPDGYETVIGERGVTLSGGQRQRLAIARALLTDPRILILDDSTSAIDSATEDEIQKAIRRVLNGRTTLLITHRLSQIRWADQILVVEKGELLDHGTHEELLGRCEVYRHIFVRHEGANRANQETKKALVNP